jgi:hypothetical protein
MNMIASAILRKRLHKCFSIDRNLPISYLSHMVGRIARDQNMQ